MSDGRLTVWIGEREALPVRAIPYATGWAVSPDRVAKDLSQPLSKDFSRITNLSAYHLAGGVPTVIAAREWDATVAKLNAVAATLKRQFPDHDSGYAAWRKTAAQQLPKTAFVWLDEFTARFSAWREEQEFFDQRPGDNELILAPILDEQVIQMIFESFAIGDSGSSSIGDAMSAASSGKNPVDLRGSLHDGSGLPEKGPDEGHLLAETCAQKRAALDITSKRGCPRHVLENWDKIEALHGTGADGHQVGRVLNAQLDKSIKRPSLKTVQNTLAKLRRENLIP